MDGLLSQSRVLNSSIFGGSGGDFIDVVTEGTVALSTTQTSTYHVIPASIDMDNAIVLANYTTNNNSSTSDLRETAVRTDFEVVDGTQNLRFGRNQYSMALTAYYKIVEFKNIKSIQTGFKQIDTTTSENITISEVSDVDKCFVSISFSCAYTEPWKHQIAPKLTDTTTLRLQRGRSEIYSTASVRWFVVEFY